MSQITILTEANLENSTCLPVFAEFNDSIHVTIMMLQPCTPEIMPSCGFRNLAPRNRSLNEFTENKSLS